VRVIFSGDPKKPDGAQNEKFNITDSGNVSNGNHENNYTLTEGKKCNEKSLSCDAHPDSGLSFQVQLLLEF
jgi:hypothetical protein